MRFYRKILSPLTKLRKKGNGGFNDLPRFATKAGVLDLKYSQGEINFHQRPDQTVKNKNQCLFSL